MRKAIAYLIAAAMILCFVGEILLLVRLPNIRWDTRLGIPLQIIGFYGLGLGVVARSTGLKEVIDFPAEMTSPNLMEFIAGNMTFLSLPVFTASIAMSSSRKKGGSVALGCLGSILWLVISIFIMFVYVPFHLAVVMPMAYPGYVMMSALFESLQYSAIDKEFQDSQGQVSKRFRLRELIVSDPVAAKNFMIGIPALMLALGIKLLALFLA
jgi:hypothetical protein